MISRLSPMALPLCLAWTAAFAAPSEDLERCFEEASSTAAMRRCNEARLRHYDQQLNEVYRQLMQRLEARERKNLRQAQRAWIRYRDAECHFEGFEMRGGTGEWVLVGGCLAEMTRRRADELRKILEGIDQREGD